MIRTKLATSGISSARPALRLSASLVGHLCDCDAFRGSRAAGWSASGDCKSGETLNSIQNRGRTQATSAGGPDTYKASHDSPIETASSLDWAMLRQFKSVLDAVQQGFPVSQFQRSLGETPPRGRLILIAILTPSSPHPHPHSAPFACSNVDPPALTTPSQSLGPAQQQVKNRPSFQSVPTDKAGDISPSPAGLHPHLSWQPRSRAK